jgi:protein NRD1
VYVLDSVVRGWIDKSKAAGQSISKNAAPGTFASGVQKITDFMPTVMTKLVQSAPEDQKDRISKLIDIWERGQTFPPAMIATFKDQLNKSHHSKNLVYGSGMRVT